MSLRNNVKIIIIIVIGGMVLSAVLFFIHPAILKKAGPVVWRESFIPAAAAGTKSMPGGWLLEKKPGTRPAIFSVEQGGKRGFFFIHMEADNASASLVTKVDSVNLNTTPIVRWRWRATLLPEGADGRVKSKDDQAIGIYVGTGGVLNNKSISYRWDTDTPKGAEGNCAYGLGAIRIKWYTLKNKEDAAGGQWFTEERNVAEDFKKAWGFCPDNVYLSVSCNSQYTRSQAAADLAWIEFVQLKSKVN